MRRITLGLLVSVALISSNWSPAFAADSTPPPPAVASDLSPSPSALATQPAPAAVAAEAPTPAPTPSDATSSVSPAATSPAPVPTTQAATQAATTAAPTTAAPTPAAALVPVPSPGPAAITAKYTALGGAAGPLGAAAADAVCTADGGCYQVFTAGRIYWIEATGAWAVTGRVLTAYLAAGEPTADGAGYPVADTQTLSSTAEWQAFQRAALYAGDTTGSWFTLGAIGDKYQTLGGPASRLGMPTGAQTCGLRDGGCSQLFKGGAIVWSPGTGARISVGAIRGTWQAYGYENGRMGYPITDEFCGLKDGGCYQMYQGGAIVWSSGTGARISVGAIRGTWQAYGYENGRMGYPITDEFCGLKDGGCYQMYQGGAIVWSSATGAHISVGGIRDVWASQGYENGWLGYPGTDEICSGTDCVQKFQGGVISWRNGYVRTYGYNECDTLNDWRSVYASQGARSVTFAVAEAYGRSDAWIIRCMNIAGVYVNDWATPGTVGASGFKPPGVASGPTRYLYSPSGSYSFTDAFGLGNPGTGLNYITLNPNSRWGGNPWTSTYNTYFESSDWVGYDENMWYFATRPQHDYRQGAVINYNRPPDSAIVQDAGFAIFLHENPVPTAGCVAIPEWYMVDWLQKAGSMDRMIMGVRSDLFR